MKNILKDKNAIKKIKDLFQTQNNLSHRQLSIIVDEITQNSPAIFIKRKPNVIQKIIKPYKNFPNNSKLPLVIYKHAILMNHSIAKIKKFIVKNGWHKLWVDTIYPYSHYHSNTHEALIIYSGHCLVKIGATEDNEFMISQGDVIFFPAGVAHKKMSASEDFKAIGCYPFNIDYDMNIEFLSGDVKDIENVKLPNTDPIFGNDNVIVTYWK